MTSAESSPQMATPDSTAARTLAWAASTNLTTWFSRETTSTNTIAKSRVSVNRSGQNLADVTARATPILYLTERQTAGRGRGDHTWTTPQGALLSTWSFPLTFAPQPILSPLVGLALFEAATRAFADVAFNLKAPNDLYVGSQKIAGLLIETVMMGSEVTCAVGLGFNAAAAPADLNETAIGLESLLPGEMIASQWSIFLTTWLRGLNEALEMSRHSEMNDSSRVRLCAALNLHPHLPEKVVAIGAQGEIQMISKTLAWSRL